MLLVQVVREVQEVRGGVQLESCGLEVGILVVFNSRSVRVVQAVVRAVVHAVIQCIIREVIQYTGILFKPSPLPCKSMDRS